MYITFLYMFIQLLVLQYVYNTSIQNVKMFVIIQAMIKKQFLNYIISVIILINSILY